MNERRLWAVAARVIMEDAARIIRAARKQERGLRHNSTNYAIADGEEARQLAYFDSADWRMVCACAGIDVSSEQSKRAVLAMAGVQDGRKAVSQPGTSDNTRGPSVVQRTRGE